MNLFTKHNAAKSHDTCENKMIRVGLEPTTSTLMLFQCAQVYQFVKGKETLFPAGIRNPQFTVSSEVWWSELFS